ncbi:MAG: glycosyltransferase family 2 protein [Pseudomonadota bacterium]
MLSIVTSLYRSSAYVEAFFRRAMDAGEAAGFSAIEVVFVNDGSPDDSAAQVRALAAAGEPVVLVDLTRNFGHHNALLEGLAHASGAHVFMIDSDLEEDPAWLVRFLVRLDESDADIVIGQQKVRKGGWFERLSGRFFYFLHQRMSEAGYAQDQTTARLMTRRFVDALLQFPEREACFSSLCELVGFRQVVEPVEKLDTSPTTYTFARRIGLSVRTFTAYSTAPLHLMFALGLILSAGAAVFILWLVINWAAVREIPDGWTSLMVSVWFLGGLILSCLGTIGLYLATAIKEVKQRPRALVREVVRGVVKGASEPRS